MLDEARYEQLERLHIKQKLIYVISFYIVGCVFYMYMENWTLVDAVYFITVTITSVGYGDLEPSSMTCRCFTIVYAIIGLASIFGMVGEAITQYLEHIQSQALQEANSAKDAKDARREQDLMIALSVLGIFATIAFGGICYSCLEGWNLMDAVYFSSMTTLTVGYGDLAVSSQAARFFSIIYMTLSVIVFAVAVGNLQAVGIARALEERRNEMLKKELDLEALFRLDEDGDGKVTLVEFLTGALHQISGIDPEKEIHPWIQRFHELDADGNGYLDENDLKEIRKEGSGRATLTKSTSSVDYSSSTRDRQDEGSGGNCDQKSPLLANDGNVRNDYNSV